MYKSSVKSLAVLILAITLVSTMVFGTLAYFNLQIDATGTLIIGSNVNLHYCDSSGSEVPSSQTFDVTPGTKTTNFYLKKTEGVDAKVRVYLNVTIVNKSSDEPVNIKDRNGDPIITVTMGTVSGANWVDDEGASAEAKELNACWKYLVNTDGSYFRLVNDLIISVCPSITISDTCPYSSSDFEVNITLTAELLQYENASW